MSAVVNSKILPDSNHCELRPDVRLGEEKGEERGSHTVNNSMRRLRGPYRNVKAPLMSLASSTGWLSTDQVYACFFSLPHLLAQPCGRASRRPDGWQPE